MNLADVYIQKHIKSLMKDKTVPEFRAGDTIRVHNRISEDLNTERIQIFEGVCIAFNKRKLGTTFKVKKISKSMIYEKSFPLYSPSVVKIEILKRGHVRRSKLYYMREYIGKAARIKERKNK